MDADRRVVELTTLNKISTVLNQAVDLRSALQSSLEELVELMGLSTGWMFMLEEFAPDGDAGGLVHAGDYQLPPALAANHAARLKPAGCSCQELYKQGKLKEAVNIVQCSRINKALKDGGDVGGLRLHASVPIRTRDRVIGILNVASPANHHFSDEDLELMTVVGNQIGLAVERARLFDLTRAQRIEEQAALLKLSNALLTLRDLQAVVDQVVEIVAEVLATDACALLLEDPEGGVEFRAAAGWDLAKLREEVKPEFVPEAPAGLAYHSNEPVRVDDFETDERFKHPSFAYKLGFRSALAVPVRHSGETIGALIVHSQASREFDDEEVRLLQLMANQAAIAIEQARLQERALEEQRLRKELEVAQQIQTSFLPRRVPELEGWEFGVHYAAAREVGGDFYDFIQLHDPAERPAGLPGRFLEGSGLLGLVIADVSDKGVPAALFMALSRTLVRAAAISGRRPADAIERVNELILDDNRASQFVTLFYGALNPETAALHFVNAGHNPPLLVRAATGNVVPLRVRGIALGVIEPVDLNESEAQFELGDVLLMYTDGIIEAINPAGEEFGTERLTQLLVENRDRSVAELVQAIVNAVLDFAGSNEPFDDVTLVAVKRSTTL